MKLQKISGLLAILLCTVSVFGINIPSRPSPARLVNNLSKEFPNFLSSEEEYALERKLVNFDNSTSNQIAIVIVDDFDGTSKEDYANQLFRAWGIGSAKNNNGVLLLIKPTPKRELWIEVGYGLEGAIPDARANRIYQEILRPQMKVGNIYQGIDQATDALMQMAQGEYKEPRAQSPKVSPVLFIIFIIILFFILSRGGGGFGGFIFGNILGNVLSSRGSRDWDSGGGSWGGGGGGFGGFGGGSSGGGGAGGDW